MCGIMGYYSFGRTIPDKKKIEKMFVLLEARGRDASGFAYIDPATNKLKVNKSDVQASKLVSLQGWKSLKLTKMMIFHTRLKTQGEPTNNMNNHPIFTKDGLAIVHNGQIYNDKEVFTRKVKRDAQVDSEAILATLKKNQSKSDPYRTIFDTLDGVFAVAVIDQNDPHKLTLIKKNNPIELYYNLEDDILYFASEKEILQEALGIKSTYKRGFSVGENNYHYYQMADNHVLIINKNGIESYKKYQPRYPSFSYYNDDDMFAQYYGDMSLLECPYCYRQTNYNWMKLDNKCQHCGQTICEEDVYV